MDFTQQGQQYLNSYNQKLVQNNLKYDHSDNLIEGFSGAFGPTQTNTAINQQTANAQQSQQYAINNRVAMAGGDGGQGGTGGGKGLGGGAGQGGQGGVKGLHGDGGQGGLAGQGGYNGVKGVKG